MRRREFITLLGGAGIILPAAGNTADGFPTRPIRLIVPYPAGGGTDIVGRMLGQKLHESMGQPVVIDNRGGAGLSDMPIASTQWFVIVCSKDRGLPCAISSSVLQWLSQ